MTCLALLRLHLIPWLLWVPPTVQGVRMSVFFIVFSGRLALSWSDICFQVICIYFEYIHEMGIARHFEVFSQYLVKMYRELEFPTLYLAFLHVI